MATPEFEIFQTPSGVAAVSNEVQRKILEFLAAGPLQLPELVELTGKSKPTLSSLHLKELLERDLISVEGHPTDSRRKIYRLNSKRIGTSDIPVDKLRGLVKSYAKSATLEDGSLELLLDTLGKLSLSRDQWVRAMKSIGTRLGGQYPFQSRVQVIMQISTILDGFGLATTQSIDASLSKWKGLSKLPSISLDFLGEIVRGILAAWGLPNQVLVTKDGFRLAP